MTGCKSVFGTGYGVFAGVFAGVVAGVVAAAAGVVALNRFRAFRGRVDMTSMTECLAIKKVKNRHEASELKKRIT